MEKVPVLEGTGGSIAADGYVLANNFALSPSLRLLILLGDVERGRSFVSDYGFHLFLRFRLLLADELNLHPLSLINLFTGIMQ